MASNKFNPALCLWKVKCKNILILGHVCVLGAATCKCRFISSTREKKYLNAEFKETTITLKAGETYWLSQITPNYEEVSYLQPVHMLADFEIVKGCADINIAALKHTGILGDRSHHVESAAPGHYERERQYKGVADSLPK